MLDVIIEASRQENLSEVIEEYINSYQNTYEARNN